MGGHDLGRVGGRGGAYRPHQSFSTSSPVAHLKTSSLKSCWADIPYMLR